MLDDRIPELIRTLQRVRYTRKGIDKGIYSKNDALLIVESGPVMLIRAEDFLYPTRDGDVDDFKTIHKDWLKNVAELMQGYCKQRGGTDPSYETRWKSIINSSYFDIIRPKTDRG